MTEVTTIEQRLEKLTPKLATPFRQLFAKELISGKALQLILDAGELSQDTQKLLGFSVAYLHMASSGTPIADAITMAKNHKRRVNLDWSEKRWKTEHDRLSRLEALNRLAEENTVYDVSRYTSLLPVKFNGYLIKSSRRLGMEGLRQRHCVAGYHHQIQSGRCAIAAVFIDGKRWTVELSPTGKSDSPLCITQMKTRLNGQPTQEVKNRIYDQLGLSLPKTAEKNHAPRKTYLATLQLLLPLLREHGVDEVIVYFDGCGDSGSIDSTRFFPEELSNVKTLNLQYQEKTSNFDHNAGWISELQDVTGTVEEAIEHVTYDYLEETDVDWYNNDGGFGELTINVGDGTVSLDVSVRYTDSSNEYSGSRDIVTGEDIE